MLDELKKLLVIQEKDLDILKVEDQKKIFPKQLEELKGYVDNKTKQLESAKNTLKELQVNHKKLDIELESKNTARIKHENQLMGVKTNQEYKALEKEIFTLKTEMSRLEDEILEKMMVLDSQIAAIKKTETELADVKANHSKKEQEIKSTIQKLDELLQKVKSEREILIKDVDPVFFKRYTRILNHVHGKAIVAIVDRSCQGCHTLLPPQVFVDISRQKELITCDNCARLLYISEEEKLVSPQSGPVASQGKINVEPM